MFEDPGWIPGKLTQVSGWHECGRVWAGVYTLETQQGLEV
jgi:hypothetical protein